MLKLFFYIIFVGLSSVVAADKKMLHNEVLVEAGRIDLLDSDPEALTGLLTIVHKDSFATDAVSVADVIENQTGVQIRELGGHGSFSSVSIRGSSGKQVNVFLDGVLLNGSHQGAVDLSQFLLGGVEQIEIYRGNVPVYLEQSGIGGAINIKTSNVSGVNKGLISTTLGSEGLKRVASSYKGTKDSLNYLLSAEALRADNDYTVVNQKNTPNYLDDDVEENKNNSDVEQSSFLVSINTLLENKKRITVTGQYSKKDQGVPDIQNLLKNNARFESEFFSTQVKFDQVLTQDIEASYSMFGLYKHTQFTDENSTVGLLENDDRVTSETYGGDIRLRVVSGSHLWSGLISTKKEFYNLEERIKNLKGEYRRSTTTLGLQDEWVSQNGSWLINGGARFLSVFDETKKQDEIEIYHELQIGLMRQLGRETQIRVNVSKNIRLPELSEMYGDRGFSVGNDELVEESAINTDISLTYKRDNTSTVLAIFHRDLSDAIFVVYNSRGIGQADNVSSARVSGVEFNSGLKFLTNYSVNTNITYQNSENTSNSRAFRGKSLPGIFDFSGSLQLEASKNGKSVSIEYLRKEGGFYDTKNIVGLPAVKQVNVSLSLEKHSRSLEFKIKNISGQRVSDYNRFPGPGRQWFLTYSYQF